MILKQERSNSASPTLSTYAPIGKLKLCDDVAKDLQNLMITYKGDKDRLIQHLRANKQFSCIELSKIPGSLFKDVDGEPYREYAPKEKVMINGLSMLFNIECNGRKRPCSSHRNFFWTIELLLNEFPSKKSAREGVNIMKPYMNRSNLMIDVLEKFNIAVNYEKESQRSLKFLFVPLMAKANSLPPSFVEAFSDGNSHAKITMTVPVGVYTRKALMQIGSLGKQILSLHFKLQEIDPNNLDDINTQSLMRTFASLAARIQTEYPKLEPWVTFETVVTTRLNFDTGNSVRMLSLKHDSLK